MSPGGRWVFRPLTPRPHGVGLLPEATDYGRRPQALCPVAWSMRAVAMLTAVGRASSPQCPGSGRDAVEQEGQLLTEQLRICGAGLARGLDQAGGEGSRVLARQHTRRVLGDGLVLA